jgi:patatin-like phospholipase/acyl hydrolase
MGATAAPIYFPPRNFIVEDHWTGMQHHYNVIDGGVFANDPVSVLHNNISVVVLVFLNT